MAQTKTQLVGQIQSPGQPPQSVTFTGSESPVLTSAEQEAGIVWVDQRYEEGDARRYGAVLDGVADDTTPIANAIAVAQISGIPALIPGQTCKANITITGHNVHVIGGMWAANGADTVRIEPAITTSPTIQIGDGTTATKDIIIDNVTLSGDNTVGDKGVLINGARSISLNRFVINRFAEYQLKITSSATLSSTFIFINNYQITCGSPTGSLGIDIVYGSTFVTAVYLNHGHLTSSSTSSYMLQLDENSDINISNSYLAPHDENGINVKHNSCKILCSNVTIDAGGGGSDESLKMDFDGLVGSTLIGTVTMNGYAAMTSGDTPGMGDQRYSPHETWLINNQVQGHLGFTDSALAAYLQHTGGPQTCRISRSGDNLSLISEDGTIITKADRHRFTDTAGTGDGELEFGVTGITINTGSGAPSASEPKGSLYIRTDGSSTSTRMYIATDAVGTWTNFTTAA